MRATRILLPVLLLFLLETLCLLPRANAQTFRGGINGTVTDGSGAVIPAAKISATDVATSTVRDTVSSSAGEFSFNDLPLDTYKVKVDAPGFQSTQVTGV